MGDVVKELEARSDVDKVLLGYLNFIRERRNETQHPEKMYDQRESENIFTEVINAVTAMRRESFAKEQRKTK